MTQVDEAARPARHYRTGPALVIVVTAAVIASLAFVIRPAAATSTTFGADLASAGVAFGMDVSDTEVNNASPAHALPAGHLVPHDGVITGWRVKTLGGGGQLLQFRVMRGNTSIHLGPVVDIGAADGISATFPEAVAVKQGDRIGLTNPSPDKVSRAIIATSANSSADLWTDPLGAAETRVPDTTVDQTLLIQADLTDALCGGKAATIVGHSASETIKGTEGDDVILALGGSDLVKGRGGDDTICGDGGGDTLKGGPGDDQIFGERGKDTLRGGTGTDYCEGGPRKDTFRRCEVKVQ